jgi:hypothetical protein
MMDKNGKGSTKDSIAIANTFVRMGQWYRAFRSLKENTKIKKIMCDIFEATDDDKKINKINEFYETNKGLGNGISGENAIILNAMLYLNSPYSFISALSLGHRTKMLKNICGIDKDLGTFGEKIIFSNKFILEYFKKNNITASPRTITCFLYEIRAEWDNQNGIKTIELGDSSIDGGNIESDEQMFVLEKHFEDFLIGNWEYTDLGKKYNLIYDNGDLKSQQYKTDIGKIDILVTDKATGSYVIIELKRNQTSDETVGQVLRYMGWVKEKLANGADVKGIIIGYEEDAKLSYALKSTQGVDLFLYRVSFSLIQRH